MEHHGRTQRTRPARRRGVVAVLAMMFLILFGSLGAAMAIVSKGNLRTASTNQHVMRAMGAAETGLSVAASRLANAASRFIVEKGQVGETFGWHLWTGSLTGPDGQIVVLPPPSGHGEYSDPAGIAEAVANRHAADLDIVEIDGLTEPSIGPAPDGTDPAVYMLDYWVTTPALALHGASENGTSPAFQIVYAPLANGTDIRVIVTGFDFDYERPNTPLTRVLMQDFRLVKRVNHAIVSPSRIMIGKNVLIHGDLGCAYTDVDQENGHPLMIRSDFRGLSPLLDAKLDDLYAGLADYDIDGDGRLRVDHPIEGLGVPSGETDYDGDTTPDYAFADVTQDGYVDEFDVFIRQFDANEDGKVTLSADLTLGTPADGMTPEFVDAGGDPIDEDLALLIDSSNPDRNRNGIYGFEDLNRNGRWDYPDEPLLDYDDDHGIYRDQVLGYRDGFIDRRDLYAKVNGKLMFKVVEADWAAAHPDYADELAGTIIPSAGDPPLTFDAPDKDLPDISADSFTNSRNALSDAADGALFENQVAAQLGISVNDLADYVETKVDPDSPKYYRLDPDTDGDGLPDNHDSAYFEKMPYNSPAYADWYYRPVYENMVFKDVRIPTGNNGLYRNCTFAGVTFVDSHLDNTHVNWSLYGKLKLDDNGRPVPDPDREVYGDDPGEDQFPPMLPPSALPPEQILSISFDTPLDKGDIPADQIAMITNYDDLPDPLVIDGKRITDTKALSNNLRFHDCLFVGSIVSNSPDVYTHVRNKLQFTGGTRFVSQHPDYPDDPDYNPETDDLPEIAKSSMMLPNYSVDIGSFNSPPTQYVDLRGAIIAGVLDVRGSASIDGALLLTFKPVAGEGPLQDIFGNPVGNPAGFNTTLGYFGPDDGDNESLDPADLPIVDGVKIVGWDTNGDGLADVGPFDAPPDGATAVPFYGYGGIDITFDPDLVMPDGILLPLQVDPVPLTYKEGRQ